MVWLRPSTAAECANTVPGLRIRGQQRTLEGGARGNSVIRNGSATSNADVTATLVAHASTVAHRSHTTTTPDETRIDNFQARSNTARYGIDGNLVNNPHNRGLATASDAG